MMARLEIFRIVHDSYSFPPPTGHQGTTANEPTRNIITDIPVDMIQHLSLTHDVWIIVVDIFIKRPEKPWTKATATIWRINMRRRSFTLTQTKNTPIPRTDPCVNGIIFPRNCDSLKSPWRLNNSLLVSKTWTKRVYLFLVWYLMWQKCGFLSPNLATPPQIHTNNLPGFSPRKRTHVP